MRFLRKTQVTCVLLMVMLCSPISYAADVTMNFKNADIRAFIEFVSGFSGKNFLIDNRVKGNVTIISPTPISSKEAYDVFLSVLEVNGFATVNSGSVIKVVPRAESKQKAVTVRQSGLAPRNDEMITQVLRLKYADAQQLVALLRPLISPNSHLVAYPRGNMLLLTDSASNIRRIQGIMKLVDRQDAVGVQIFTLKHASADKLATTLTGLYAGSAGKGSPNAIRALSHQPGNILIVVAAPQMINEVGEVVRKLDIKPEPDSGRLQVRYLKHGNAVDVAKVINELVGGASTAAVKAGPNRSLFAGAVKIVAEPATNALLITADPSDMNSLNGIIDKLDVRRLQVLIEALIVEVSSGVGEQIGIEWRSMSDFNGGSTQTFGGTTFSNSGGTNINSVAANPFSAGSGLMIGVSQGTVSFGGLDFLNLGALARALSTKSDTNVLSTPSLLTMDNEEAEIIVGQNVPFLTGQNSTQGGTANPFQTIERKDIGLTLRVKPQISAGNTVRLELYQEMSSIDRNPGVQGSDLITNKRSIKTVVLANDGQVIVLGGLMRDDANVSSQQVPCLGSLPVLGEAFKFSENERRKTNLMVFLRPHIIKTARDLQTITNQKYSDISDLYENSESSGSIFFPHAAKTLPQNMQPMLGTLKMEESLEETTPPTPVAPIAPEVNE
ncbi:MAG: type II secretion system secretin GspD [Mariprofundaceae bacterium]|nr:type II secretion system secretin GspD [Mariprofundaceae bacterium]